jgi:hypothetical protein
MGDEFQKIDIFETSREKLPKMFEVAIMIVDSTINQKDVVQEGANFGHINCIQIYDELKDQANYNSSFMMLKSECFDSN